MKWTLGLVFLTSNLSLSAPGPMPPNISPIILGVGFSSSLKIPDLQRVALGNSKIAKARVLPPHTLLITGLKEGRTMARLWTQDGKENAISIDVIPASEGETTSQETTSSGVVHVCLEFLEVDSTLNRALGLKWPETIQFSAQSAFSGNAQTSGLNYGAQIATAKGWFRYLAQSGTARLLAQPEIYVRLGEKADFHSGGEFPVPSTSESFGRIQRQVQWKPFGTTVSVRPKSWDRFRFKTDITVEVSEVSSMHAVDNIPSVTRRRLDTKINSRDGETVILSGLTRQVENHSEEGVPLLSSIPILGGIFSHSQKTHQDVDILLSVTLQLSTASRQDQRRKRILDRTEEVFSSE